jgi:two-component system chemotaxis response regulator CheB
MGGLELTQRIMAEYPRPILVISASVDRQTDAENIFQVLQAGAVDVLSKPTVELLSQYEQIRQDLITRIKILSGVSVFTQRRQTSRAPQERPGALRPAPIPSQTSPLGNPHLPLANLSSLSPGSLKVVAIGASTGGPQALCLIFKALPRDFPLPILCVQHISPGFLDGLVRWLATESELRVVVAQGGDRPKPGYVYCAPENSHLELDAQGAMVLTKAAPVSGHCPSATVLFESVASQYGRAGLGVLLTGMGGDGATGLLAIAQAGGTTIAQDESSCVVFGMPKEAIALGAAQQILPLDQIAPTLIKSCTKRLII